MLIVRLVLGKMESITEQLGKIDNVEVWLNSRESETTKHHYSSRINLFREFVKQNYGLDISEIKEKYREAKYKGEIEKEKFLDWLSDIIESYTNLLRQRGYCPTSLHSCLSILQSYLKKGCKIKEIDIQLPKHLYQKYHNRDITKEEIRKILEHAPIRERLFYLMLAESGLRPRTLVQLRFKHIKQDYLANKTPLAIKLPSEILKDRISERFCFVGEDSVRLLREYLSLRKDISDEDYIFLPDVPKRMRKKYLSPETFSNKFSKIVLKLGLDKQTEKGQPKELRLYCLRKYWFKYMRAESTFKNFWFCHKTVNDHYITRDIEVHRQEYAKYYDDLRIYEPTQNSKVQDLEVKLSQAYQTMGELQQKLNQSVTMSELMELFKGTLPMDIYQKLEEKLKAKTTSSKISEYV